MTKNEPTPTEGVEQPDGSVVWPTDPNFIPTSIPEQDLTPLDGDDEIDEDFTDVDSEADLIAEDGYVDTEDDDG